MRKVEVVNYRESWNAEFQIEAAALREAIGFLEPNIHHIGSTSVPALSAKPVIDMLLELDDLDLLVKHASALEAIGYCCRGENGIPGRLYFEKGGEDRSHQIHAFVKDSPGAMRHLAFRDYLRNHPAVADEYALLKKRVASTCNNDIERYCDGKDEFIKKHERIALDWYLQNRPDPFEAGRSQR